MGIIFISQGNNRHNNIIIINRIMEVREVYKETLFTNIINKMIIAEDKRYFKKL